MQIQDSYHFNYSVLEQFKEVPFTLSMGWAEYRSVSGNNVKYFIDNKDVPRFIAFGFFRKSLGTSFLLIEGFSYNSEVIIEEVSNFFSDLIKISRASVILNLNTIYNPIVEAGIREAGFKRPLGSNYTSLSILLNVKEYSPNRNWKRNSTKAIKNGLHFKCETNYTQSNISEFIKLFNENTKEKNLHHSINAKELESMFKDENMMMCFIEDSEGRKIAGRIIYFNKNISYDVYAANGNISRNTGASFLLMDSIFNLMHEKGSDFFDFSRIPFGKKNALGVIQFKLSSNGSIIQYMGEWSYFRNKILKGIYYAYNMLYLRKELY
ncbi:MAG: hypothetical protein A2X08_06055 [Bacteroidetes bacterium GWA2_32_17]|nr:MAG: hypothetical protein A2X08_06055 [Bacteroidetes bacterium GWA2_32_17]